MVKSNKFLTVPLVAVLSLSLLSSCGGQGEIVGKGQPTTAESASPTQTLDGSGGGKASSEEIRHALTGLNIVKDQIKVVKEFSNEINPNQELNYQQATEKVKEIGKAYKQFIDQLPSSIKQDSIFINDLNKKNIEDLVASDSPQTKIIKALTEANPSSTRSDAKLNEAQQLFKDNGYANKAFDNNSDDINKLIGGLDGLRTRKVTKLFLTDLSGNLETYVNHLAKIIEGLAQSDRGGNIFGDTEAKGKDNSQSQTNQNLTQNTTQQQDYTWNLALMLLNLVAIGMLLRSTYNTRKTLEGTLITYKRKTSDINANFGEWLKLKEQIQIIESELNQLRNNISSPAKHKKSWWSKLPMISQVLPQRVYTDEKEAAEACAQADTTLPSNSTEEVSNQLIRIRNDLQEIYLKALLAQTGVLGTSEALVVKRIEEIIEDARGHNLPPENTDNKLDQIIKKLDVNYELVRNNLTGSSRQRDSGSSSETLNEIQVDLQAILSQLNLLSITSSSPELEKLKAENQKLSSQRNQFRDELADKEKQIQQLSSEDINLIKQQHQELQESYNQLRQEQENLSQQQGTVAQEKETLQQHIQELQKRNQEIDTELTQVKIDLDSSNQINQALQQEKASLEQDKERLKKEATKQAPQQAEVPGEWEQLVEAYKQDSQSIFNYATSHGEFVEDEQKGNERYDDNTKPVIFTSSQSGEYYIVSLSTSQAQDYLLFPKNHAIPASQKFTATGSFEGYKQGNTNPFNLTVPAQVSPLGNGMWQLRKKGRLKYS